MPRQVIDLYEGRPIVDLVSYGRGAQGNRLPLSRAQIDQITRTVRRVPEVVVKVLPKDSNDAKSIRNHIGYIGRQGKLELEGDDGTIVSAQRAGERLLEDWDLDLETQRRNSEFTSTRGRPAPKLVHKLIFSMPPGTAPQRVLAAVRDFAREEFALKHRYAMVLHTDEPHPHVHLVVKAVSEQGSRLTIRKATLRMWRAEFARRLREQGIAANATERAVRGQVNSRKVDGVYRAVARNDSSHMRQRTQQVANELSEGGIRIEPGKGKLAKTRRDVQQSWRHVTAVLTHQKRSDLATEVLRFVDQMPPPLTEKEQIAAAIVARMKESRISEPPLR